MTWFSVVSALLVLAGAFFSFFGLGVLGVGKDVLPQFEGSNLWRPHPWLGRHPFPCRTPCHSTK